MKSRPITARGPLYRAREAQFFAVGQGEPRPAKDGCMRTPLTTDALHLGVSPRTIVLRKLLATIWRSRPATRA